MLQEHAVLTTGVDVCTVWLMPFPVCTLQGRISEALLQRLVLKPTKIAQLAEGIRAIAQQVTALPLSTCLQPLLCSAPHCRVLGDVSDPLLLSRACDSATHGLSHVVPTLQRCAHSRCHINSDADHCVECGGMMLGSNDVVIMLWHQSTLRTVVPACRTNPLGS